MNGTKILLDTNIIVYLLDGDKTLSNILFGKQLYVSVITELELLSFGGLTEKDRTGIENFLETCNIIDLNSSVKREVITLRSSNKIKLPDAIIMATAKVLDVPVITSDQDFNKVEGISVVNYEYQQ